MSTRRLVLLRHAKSDWPDGVPDRLRPLGKRGRREAPEAGRWLRSALLDPDLALVSPAERTRQTWELVAEAARCRVEPVFDERIYGAGAEDLLEVIQEVPAGVSTLLVVGHNPGMENLVEWLDDGRGPAPDRLRVHEKFPTGAIAVLHAELDTWAELDEQRARLAAFVVPRPGH